jgi:chloride channel protein, CIC family
LERLVATIRAFIRKHWQQAIRVRQKLRFSEETLHLVLAGGVGVIGGLVNMVFHHAIAFMEALFHQRPGDPAKLEGDYSLSVILEKLLIPTAGGLLAGLALYWGLRLAGKQRSSNLLEVVVTSDGRLPFRSSLVKAGSSLLSIGSGASIGREGAITDLAAMLASKWGQLAHWQPYRLRLLTACGAASGIAATYNAPMSGAIFSALIVLGNFSMNLFAPLVFSSVVAFMVSRGFFGLQPWYEVPAFNFTHLSQLPWFLVLGVLTGAMGAMFLKMLQRSQDRFRKLPVPVYVRLAIGGLVVGAIAIIYPGVWGNGYGVTNQVLRGEYLTREFPLLFLLGLFAAKLLATLATVGSGAVGGVFTPTLFLGAGLGAIWGTVLHGINAGMELPVAAFALAGMGSMLAATTRSPLLAMIMAFEISLNYSVMPPLMLACVVSTLVARRLHPESIYTEPLRAKGLTLDRESLRPGTATEQTVGDLMHAPVPPLRETATLREIAERFLSSSNNFLPVVDAKQQLIGLVALQDLKEHLNPGAESNAVIAYDVMRPPPATVTPNQLLLDTLPVMLASEQRNVPVVNSHTENRLVGAVVRAEVLGLLSEAIAIKSQPASPPAELSLPQNAQNGQPAEKSGQ